MQYFKDIIISFITKEATYEEITAIKSSCDQITSQSDGDFIKQAIDIYKEKENSLLVIKFIKDRKGWNLKDSKAFFDLKIRHLLILISRDEY